MQIKTVTASEWIVIGKVALQVILRIRFKKSVAYFLAQLKIKLKMQRSMLDL